MRLRAELQHRPKAGGTGVRAIVVQPDGQTARFERLEVSSEASPAKVDAAFHRVVDEARRAAGSDAGGAGDSPAVQLRLPLSEAWGTELAGTSIGLSAYLAFLAHFARFDIPGVVAATGWPGEPLGDLPAKLAAIERERPYLALPPLIAAGSDVPAADPRLTRAHEPADAARAVWCFVPWAECAARRPNCGCMRTSGTGRRRRAGSRCCSARR